MELRNLIKDIIIENQSFTIPDLKDRDIETSALLNNPLKKIFTFTGFRRVGKTYLLYLLIQKIDNCPVLYFNFEDERLPESTEVLTELLYAYEELYHKKPDYLFLDEIHIIPGWGKYLRRILNQEYRLYITGSSSKLGLTEIPTELRGRTINQQIFPLSFIEYLKFKGIQIENNTYIHTQLKAEINHFFEEFVIKGGFPELVDANEMNRKEIIHEYYRTLVQRDLIDRFNIKEEALIAATIKLIMNSLTISISKLTNTLKSMGFRCSKNTIANYIRYMEQSYFLIQSFFYSTNMKDQLQYPRKIYLIDNGFIKYLTVRPDKGRSLENLVALELKRNGVDLFYWKNTRGEEVDFVVMSDGFVQTVIQVCYDLTSSNTKEREIKGLKKAMQFFNIKKGFVVTPFSNETIIEDNYEINIIPFIEMTSCISMN